MIFNTVIETSKRIKNGRTPFEVFCSVEEEVGELAKEMRIKYGRSYKTADEDGVFGECVDIISALIDLMYLDNPDLTEEEILPYLKKKLNKWETKEKEYLEKQKAENGKI